MGAHSEEKNIRRLIPVPRFNDFHPDPSPAALRWMIFTNKNGFDCCIVRRGRRILIDEVEYFKWLDRNNEKHHDSSDGRND